MIYGYARVTANDGNSLKRQRELLKQDAATKRYEDSFTGTKTDQSLIIYLKSLKIELLQLVTKIFIPTIAKIFVRDGSMLDYVIPYFSNIFSLSLVGILIAVYCIKNK